MKIFLIILAIIAFIILLFFVAGYFIFLHICKRNIVRDPQARGFIRLCVYKPYEDIMAKGIRDYENLESEVISVTSEDSLKLVGSYFPCKNGSNKLIIAFHGYRSSAKSDFCCITPKFIENGYSVITVDQRSHGRSEGKYICFGGLERYDCKKWCEYAVDRFGKDTEIYLYGISMGASTVLMSANVGLPKNVKGIIADCGFTVPFEIIKNTMWHKNKLPPYPIIYFVNFLAERIAKFDFKEPSTVKSVKNSNLPILFIHGSADTYVPPYMSKEAFDVSGERGKLVIIDRARHARSFVTNSEKYLSEVFTFLEQGL